MRWNERKVALLYDRFTTAKFSAECTLLKFSTCQGHIPSNERLEDWSISRGV